MTFWPLDGLEPDDSDEGGGDDADEEGSVEAEEVGVAEQLVSEPDWPQDDAHRQDGAAGHGGDGVDDHRHDQAFVQRSGYLKEMIH